MFLMFFSPHAIKMNRDWSFQASTRT